MAAECLEAADGLHVNEDHFLVEAVDPETGVPVPDGTPGELVFTTVTREALPLLRYRTGDIASLRRGTCACGRTLVRMSKVTGRRDDMLVLRGVNVYPSEVERVLLAAPALCPDYLLVVDERAAAARLIVCCEYKTNVSGPVAARRAGRVRGGPGAGCRGTGGPAARGARGGRRGPGAARGHGAAQRGRQGGPGDPVARRRPAAARAGLSRRRPGWRCLITAAVAKVWGWEPAARSGSA